MPSVSSQDQVPRSNEEGTTTKITSTFSESLSMLLDGWKVDPTSITPFFSNNAVSAVEYRLQQYALRGAAILRRTRFSYLAHCCNGDSKIDNRYRYLLYCCTSKLLWVCLWYYMFRDLKSSRDRDLLTLCTRYEYYCCVVTSTTAVYEYSIRMRFTQVDLTFIPPTSYPYTSFHRLARNQNILEHSPRKRY